MPDCLSTSFVLCLSFMSLSITFSCLCISPCFSPLCSSSRPCYSSHLWSDWLQSGPRRLQLLPGCLRAGPLFDGRWDKAKSMEPNTEPGPHSLSFQLRQNFCLKQLGWSLLYNYSNTLFEKVFFTASQDLTIPGIRKCKQQLTDINNKWHK